MDWQAHKWEIVAVAVDGALAWLVYYFYKKETEAATRVEVTQSFLLNSELLERVKQASDGELPYVCVEGKVETTSNPLRSRFTADDVGVIRRSQLYELKSKRDNGFWHDVKRTIRDDTDWVQFFLKGDINVTIEQPLQSDHLLDSLTMTHDNFNENKSNFLEKSLDRIFGEVTRGYHESEHMLPVGCSLLGIGRIRWDKQRGSLMLGPPVEGRYILSTLSKAELATKLRTSAKHLKILIWALGLVGAGLVAHIVYRRVKQYMEEQKLSRENETLRTEYEAMRRYAEERGGGENGEEGRTCVVCLDHPRNTILLNCGHVCVCNTCVAVIPRPRKCPVCRAAIREVRPVYIP